MHGYQVPEPQQNIKKNWNTLLTVKVPSWWTLTRLLELVKGKWVLSVQSVKVTGHEKVQEKAKREISRYKQWDKLLWKFFISPHYHRLPSDKYSRLHFSHIMNMQNSDFQNNPAFCHFSKLQILLDWSQEKWSCIWLSLLPIPETNK